MNCPNCGLEVPGEVNLCRSCGTNLAASNEPATPSAKATTSGFIGRQRELAELTAALAAACSGQGRLVMLAGEPGIGKTRTAQEVAAIAESQGFQVLWGRCYEDEGAPPYWPWVQLLRSSLQQDTARQLLSQLPTVAAALAEVLPEINELLPDLPVLPSLIPEQARFRLFDSITSFFKQMAQRQPLMLVLDDLHWADRASLSLLLFVTRQLEGSSLLLIGNYRDLELSRQHPLSETLAQLTREPAFRRQGLGGLSQEDTGRFIKTLSGLEPEPSLVESIYSRTEGNPFFMREVLQLWSEQSPGIASHSAQRIPASVREVVGQRLNRLSTECNRVLTIASVIGREFNFKLLKLLNAEGTEEQLLAVIDEALVAHLIEELPGVAEGYQFSHALVQETLVQELSAARRARLHALIAEALETLYGADSPAHAAELAYRFAEAESVLGTEKLVSYCLLAGGQALSSYAWEEALQHFRRGIGAMEGRAIDASIAELLFGLGRAESAILERGQTASISNNFQRAFDYYAAMGDVNQAVAVVLEHPGLPAVTSHDLTELVARALALVPAESHLAGQLLSRYGDQLGGVEANYGAAQDAFGRAIAIAHREKDTDLEMRTLASAARVAGRHCQWEECLEMSQRAIHLAKSTIDPSFAVPASHWAMNAASFLGDLEQAREYANAAIGPAERFRHRSILVVALDTAEIVARIAGQFTAARALNDRALALSPLDGPTIVARVLLECQVGNISQMEAYLDKLVRHQERRPRGTLTLGLIWYLRRLAPLIELAETDAHAILSSRSAIPIQRTWARATLGLMGIYRCDQQVIREQYEALKGIRGNFYNGVIADDRLLGILCHGMGDLAQASAHFEDSLAFCRKAGYRPELAWTCHDYAETLLQRNGPGDHVKATSLLEEALTTAQELGMRPLLERVLGLRERAQSRLGRAPAYPDGLSQREVEVLRLIAQGMTDREIAQTLIISARTVGVHVGNILNKTGAINRTEAATYATRHGLTGN